MVEQRVWAEVDLDVLSRNLRSIRERVGARTRILLVVKADAYGHGAVAIAHHALKEGVSALGVGTSAEALELRATGIHMPILVLGTVIESEVVPALQHGIHLGLHSTDRLRRLNRVARRLGLMAHVHLNVDTGLSRLGVTPPRALELLHEIRRAPHVRLAGIMTHLATPIDDGVTQEQARLFARFLRDSRSLRPQEAWIHIASSAAIYRDLRPLYDTVRPGIAAYGLLGDDFGSSAPQPILSVRTQVAFLKDLPTGTQVGYAGDWSAPRPTRLATIPLGYDGGLPWRLSNRGALLIRGVRAPIIGRISMDYTTLDVTDIPGARVGDPVTVIGRDGEELLTAADLAESAGTLPHEITCSFGRRVPRTYQTTEPASPLSEGHERLPGQTPSLEFGA